MKSTSRGSRLVRIAARSPGFASTGPEVIRNPTPNSRAMICASVVLPRPGGPWNSVWSIASPRIRALSMNTARLARASACPMNSASICGRSALSVSSGSRSAAQDWDWDWDRSFRFNHFGASTFSAARISAAASASAISPATVATACAASPCP